MAAIQSLDIQFSLQHRELINASAGRGGTILKNLFGQAKGYRKKVTNGTSANQIDLAFFRDTPTAIAASGNQDFDLAGSLTDSFGTTITMAKICGILVLNWNTAGTLTVRSAGTNGNTATFLATGDGYIVGKAADSENPGMFWVWMPQGATVTAGTGDMINLLNNDSSNAANYTIGLFGRTA